MQFAFYRKIVWACCLGLILQSTGIAASFLGCGCIWPWGMGCCPVLPADTVENGCCCVPPACELPACCEPADECRTPGSDCSCSQAPSEQVAMPTFSRFTSPPDLTHSFLAVADVALSPKTRAARSVFERHISVAPRSRLNSLLCVWII